MIARNVVRVANGLRWAMGYLAPEGHSMTIGLSLGSASQSREMSWGSPVRIGSWNRAATITMCASTGSDVDDAPRSAPTSRPSSKAIDSIDFKKAARRACLRPCLQTWAITGSVVASRHCWAIAALRKVLAERSLRSTETRKPASRINGRISRSSLRPRSPWVLRRRRSNRRRRMRAPHGFSTRLTTSGGRGVTRRTYHRSQTPIRPTSRLLRDLDELSLLPCNHCSTIVLRVAVVPGVSGRPPRRSCSAALTMRRLALWQGVR